MTPPLLKDFRRWRKYHAYFRRTGFYQFVLVNTLKVLLVLAILIGLFLLFQKYIFDFRPYVDAWLRSLNWVLVLVVFFISESFLGLMPPDFFILWANQFIYPYLAVFVLAILSYAGGFISYLIGLRLHQNQYVRDYLSRKYSRFFRLIKQWGRLFVMAAAIFPLPYSLVCILLGMVRFPVRRFALYGLTRFLRFFIWALVFFSVVN